MYTLNIKSNPDDAGADLTIAQFGVLFGESFKYKIQLKGQLSIKIIFVSINEVTIECEVTETNNPNYSSGQKVGIPISEINSIEAMFQPFSGSFDS